MSGAAARHLAEAIDYPSSDGEPMAETDLHRDEAVALIEMLKARYADRKDVYVAGNLLVYYEEGNAKARFAPDVFVVFGTAKRQRRTYKLWEEKKAPSVVIEVTSRGTSLEDEGNKKILCARLGVAEYYLYDPAAECLAPPLQGFQLRGGAYAPLRPGAGGSLKSAALGLKLALHGSRIQLVDFATGERSLRPEEERVARREAEARAKEAEARAKAAEAELARLRARAARGRGRG